MSPKPSQDLIDRLGAASLEAKEVIREGHQLLKDLKVAIKEAREIVEHTNEETIAPILQEHLKEVVEEIGVMQHKLYERCLDAFNKLADSMGIGPRNHDLLDEIVRHGGTKIETPSEGLRRESQD